MNAFGNARVPVQNFMQGTLTLKHFIKQAYGKKPLFAPTLMVIHVREPFEGGLSEIEFRALIEMAFLAGARKFCVCTLPQELTNEQILAINQRSRLVAFAWQSPS